MSSEPRGRRACLAFALAGLGAPLARAGTRRAARRADPLLAGQVDLGSAAQDLAARHSLDADWVQAHLGRARHVEAVRRLIMPSPAGVAKDWTAYRDRFIEPQRIGAGVLFWREHERWLDEAEQRWGVPPEVVVAIVGVETFYGRITGNFRVLDALATLAFDFPSGRSDRSGFFRDELGSLLQWCRREGLDPEEPRGSYAGAIGLPQFMPSSILKYGVDFDGDGHVDLRGNPADTVGSVARYLAEFGWQRGLPTHYDVQPPAAAEDRALLLAPDIRPSFSAAQLAERGADLEPAGRNHEGPLALVELENGARPRAYFAGSTNFYAITRYNWSSYYAMAVILLAQALRRAA